MRNTIFLVALTGLHLVSAGPLVNRADELPTGDFSTITVQTVPNTMHARQAEPTSITVQTVSNTMHVRHAKSIRNHIHVRQAATSKPASSAPASSTQASSKPAASTTAAGTSKPASSAPAPSAPASSAPISSAPAKNTTPTTSAPAEETTCPVADLTADTWKKEGLDKWLADFAAKNLTPKTTNNIQDLSAALGAPNFFCGLDQFCNAGQPCLPVDTPGWYVLLAIQNWNSYMNAINTAITFSSSILSLTLPGMVKDLWPKPNDDVTPMKTFYTMFATILQAVPLTGPVGTATGAVGKGLTFVMNQIQPPAVDRFAVWTDIAGEMGKLVSEYQAQTSKSFRAIIDAPVNDTKGISSVLADGSFMGTAQNFTQADLQSTVSESIKLYAAGVILRSAGIHLGVARSATSDLESCRGRDIDFGSCSMCVENGPGDWVMSTMINSDNTFQNDLMDLLTSKYGMDRKMILIDSLNCDPAKGDPFKDALPLDAKTPCLFYLTQG